VGRPDGGVKRPMSSNSPKWLARQHATP